MILPVQLRGQHGDGFMSMATQRILNCQKHGPGAENNSGVLYDKPAVPTKERRYKVGVAN